MGQRTPHRLCFVTKMETKHMFNIHVKWTAVGADGRERTLAEEVGIDVPVLPPLVVWKKRFFVREGTSMTYIHCVPFPCDKMSEPMFARPTAEPVASVVAPKIKNRRKR